MVSGWWRVNNFYIDNVIENAAEYAAFSFLTFTVKIFYPDLYK